MVLENTTKNKILATRCIVADSFAARFKGLMGRKCLPEGEALLLKPCNGIHMLFMRFSIDAIFLDEDNRIIHQIPDIRPWTISPVIRKARSVVELPAGTIQAAGTMSGDRISIS